MKVVGVIQARMGSTRLPGKTLLPIGGRPMLLRVVDRLRFCERLDAIVVATTGRPENRVIQKVCAREGIECVVYQPHHDEQVVARLQLAAEQASAEAIVRVTPDCPLIDPEVVNEVIAQSQRTYFRRLPNGNYNREDDLSLDYCSNVYPRRTYPDGLDCEYLTTEILDRLPEAEDATEYIWKNPLAFRIRSVEHEEDLSALNWTVNTAADLEFVRWVYERLPEGFGWRDVLALKGATLSPRELVTLSEFREGRFP